MEARLFLIAVVGCCVGQELLPEGPVEGVLRKNVTFKTLVDRSDDLLVLIWSFSGGSGEVPIVTVTPTEERVAEGYEGRVWVDRTNGFLTLGPLTVSDRGFYRATMVTPGGTTKAGETMLRILGYKRYPLPEGPVDAVSGTNVTFRTLMNPKDDINATAWFFSDGRQLMRVASVSRAEESVVFEAYRGRVTVDRTNGFLTLGPLVQTDSGEYHVNIYTTSGVWTGETQLRVLEPVSDVTIRANVSGSVQVNSSVILTCSANGSMLTFSWSSGTTPITADSTRLLIRQEASSSVLTISRIQSSDLLGPIYCTAANQLESQKSAPFNLTVIFPPPALTHPAPHPPETDAAVNVTIEGAGGCGLNLTCSSDADPPADTFTWYRRAASGSLLRVGSGRVLALPSLKRSSSGLYVCQAGNSSTQVLLEVDASGTSAGRPEQEEAAARGGATSTLSPHTTTPSHGTTAQRPGGTRLGDRDASDAQCACSDKLQVELVETRLSFERSLRQMESRMHSLLWSLSRRLERLTEATGGSQASSHHIHTYLSLSRPGGVSAATPPPGGRPVSRHSRAQRRQGGQGGRHS